MHPITAALEQSMAPDRIDPSRYKTRYRVKPQGFYEEEAILIGGVWYLAHTGWKINRPVTVKYKPLRPEVYSKFHPHPDSNEQA